MPRVANRKCIRRLSHKSLKASRTRNMIAVAAIILTTILFTALFTIGMTIINSFQQQTFRQVGGDMHGTFKDISEQQLLELSGDPLIVKAAARQILGMPSDAPFNKAHVEISYMDRSCAEGYFSMPTVGALPQEGTNEIACDTRILKLLGVEPEIGAEITMPYDLGANTDKPQKKQDVFTLSGWWEYDSASMASHAVVPRSYVEKVLADYEPVDRSDMTGMWSLNVYFKSAAHIEQDMKTVLANHGYQSETRQADNYIDIGVNWAYMGAQLSANADPMMIISIAGLLMLVILTGYLIIYNIFQISVANDIRFYGLLKTIGTTGRQIRTMIRRQALSLSVIGIPLGLALGWFCGASLAPQVMKSLSYKVTHVSFSPIIFIGATLFSLVTVLISCRKPGKIAGRVSPVEAVRYTEGASASYKKKVKRGAGGAKIHRMAFANLGRSKLKTVLVVLSLSLAVVLMQATYMFATGFDMDKYLRQWVVTDFIFGHADYFQTGSGFASAEQAVSESMIDQINQQGGITESGRIYGNTLSVQEFVTEDWYRAAYGRWLSEDMLNQRMENLQRTPDGKVADSAQLYGMEDLPLDQLKVIDGDLDALHDPSQNAVAAVYGTDDYDRVYEQSHWAKVGDKISLRYVDEWEYYDVRTGEVKQVEEIERDYIGWRAKKYHDETYTVAACVTMPHTMSYRYYGSDEFILNAEVFQRDTGTSNIMTYLYNTTPESNAKMEDFLADYTENIESAMDYESKQSYVDEFASFRSMFLLLGGVLSLVIGIVGVLNFLNAVLTSILTRRREFAVMQAIGMTGRQLKKILVCEGVLYAGLAVGVSLVISLAMGPMMENSLGSMFWFFTYRFTLLPIVVITPVFLALGVALPLAVYQKEKKQSIVDRIRTED